MDFLKERVGAFTEGMLIMACPVLVAVALRKVDLRSEGNALVRGSVSPLAAASLFLSSLAFILPSIASALRRWLRPSPLEFVFRLSKLLVHLCSLAQMLLASMILLLIAMNSKAYLASPLVLGFFVCCCGYWSVMRIQEQIDREDDGFDTKLESSLEFSAAVASLLFLGLEGLALEGQTGVGQDLNHLLLAPIHLTFCCCVVASFVMLLAAVPPIDYREQGRCDFVCVLLHALCGALTLTFAAVVFIIVYKLDKERGLTVLAVPCLALLLCYALCLCVPEGNQPHEHQVKPASLELTKVIFTGFLAVTIPNFRDGSLSGYTRVFITSAAMAVLFGLAWRFLTHFQRRAAVWTAKVACLFTHGCLAFALIPFMFIAMKALAGGEDECHIPCSSSPSQQLQLFITCFTKKAIETSRYALSSVTC